MRCNSLRNSAVVQCLVSLERQSDFNICLALVPRMPLNKAMRSLALLSEHPIYADAIGSNFRLSLYLSFPILVIMFKRVQIKPE